MVAPCRGLDVQAYLRRIRFDKTPRADLEGLRALHVAHLEAVPFENLDIHLGRPIVLDQAAFFDKIVRRGRGGWCFELNGLFAALLRTIGFRVTMLSAGVRDADGSYSPDLDHMTLLVELEERWLADVGFGDSFREPLRFDHTGEQVQDGRPYWVIHDGSAGSMSVLKESGITGGYRFSLRPRALADYSGRCNYLQTSPDSTFTQRIICSRATPAGRVTIANQRLIVSDRDGRRERDLGDAEWRAAFTEHFGIPHADAQALRAPARTVDRC
jgi:N-hydroxyarylamine O-acetyltransferase